MMMMMMMMCKRLAQVPMLCVPIYNIKLAMMPKKKLTFLPRFQHIRRWPPTSAGKTRCLPVTLLNHPFWTGRIMGRSCFESRFSGAQLCCPTVACPIKSPVQMARSSWLRCIQQGFILDGISYPFIFMQEKGICHCIPFTVYRIYICIYIYFSFISQFPRMFCVHPIIPLFYIYIYIPIQGGALVFNCFKKMSLELEMYLPLKKYSWTFETNAI